MKYVAVIGGGYAGFAAAAELAAAGVAVTLFEAAKVAGGRARRVEIRGLALDNGLHVLIGAYRETLRLIDLVSIPADPPGLRRVPLDLEVHPHFRLRTPRLPAPLHLVCALATARGLSLRQRMQMISFMLALRRQGFRLQSDMSVCELLQRHGQSEALCRYLWHPLCISALNTLPRHASAQVFINVLRDSLNGSRGDSDFLLPTLDFSSLFPERAARFISGKGGAVLLDRPVLTVRHEGASFSVVTAQGTRTFSHVVLAVSPHRLHTVCADLPQLADTLRCVEQFEYRPIYSVYLQYTASTCLPRPMLGLEGKITQWVFDRGQLIGQPGLLGAVISADGQHERLSNDELAMQVHADLLDAIPTLPQPQWWQVIAEKRATFACNVGLQRPRIRTALPSLFLAGDYVDSAYPATIEAAVRAGVECARQVRSTFLR